MEEKMKKTRLFTLLCLIITLAISVFVGCTEADKVSSVCLKNHDPNTAIEIAAGELNYNEYTVVVTYASGRTEELRLTEQMIEPSDLFKLYQVGDHDITLSYSGCKYTFRVTVNRLTFEGVSFPENNVFTYNGKAHTIELVGEIPPSASVVYPNGNSFINAGTYEVSAIISCDGYVTQRLSTTVKIQRARYDMSGVRLTSKDVVYDGNAHSITIEGELPEGISAPIYTLDDKPILSVVDVGNYTVKASFTNNNPNYENIPDMVATLKITPAVYDLGDLDIIFGNEGGEIFSSSSKVYDGIGVSFEINDKSLVGREIYISYTASDEQGNAVALLKNAGLYTVSMSINLIDGRNYQPIEPIVRTFEIKKAKYDTSNIYFDSSMAIYNGKPHKVLVSLPDGHDIKPEDIVYEYRLGDELIEVDASVGVINAGVYTVTAIFPDKNVNYEQITSIRPATLRIEKKAVDTEGVGFSGNSKIEYNSESHAPDFITWRQLNDADFDYLDYTEREYYVLGQGGEYVLFDGIPTDSGTYKCNITARIADEYSVNYALQDEREQIIFSFSFEIYKKELGLPKLTVLSELPFLYTSNPMAIEYDIENLSELAELTTEYFRYTPDGYVTMGADIPTNAGYYRFVITATLPEEYESNYSFQGTEVELEYVIEFEIKKIVIETPTVDFTAEASVVYDNNPHEALYEVTDNSEFAVFSTAYYRYTSGVYILMGEGELPTAAGKYKSVVTVAVSDAVNIAFDNGDASVDYSFEFEIQTRVLEVPEISFTSEPEVVYSGTEQPVEFINSAPSEFITVTAVYLRLIDGEFVPMAQNEKPLHTGEYKLTVTALVNDPNCVLADGEMSVTATFDYEITKYKIYISEIGICDRIDYNNTDSVVQYEYSGSDLRFHVFERLGYDEFKKYVTWDLDDGYIWIHDGVSWNNTNSADVQGLYEISYRLTVKNSSSCTLVYNSQEYSTLTITHYFKIV